MGRAQKLKVQRKIDRKIEEQEKKQRKARFIRGALIGFGFFILITAVYSGGVYAKKNWFPAKQEAKKSEAKVERKTYTKEPDMKIDVNKKYVARFETNDGSFEVQLNPKEAPKTVNNFVFLAREKFYDGLTFHRIVKDFMIQGGDPSGDGTGGPGYKFNDEKIVSDYTEGTIAMANSGANTNGSQFFIMIGDWSKGKLPKNYVIFGKVISGLDIVKKIGNLPTGDNGHGENSKPKDKVIINKITIEES